jgi:hypothetical protein
MSGAKLKMIKKQVGDKDLISLFNKMIGVEKPDAKVILPKYNKLKSKVKSFSKILSAMVNDILLKSFPGCKNECEQMLKFASELNQINLPDFPQLDKLTKEEDLKLAEIYVNSKKNNSIRTIIVTCKNLIGYKDNFSIKDGEFDDSFIARVPGYKLCPFTFSDLNLKEIWYSNNITIDVKKYIFTCLKVIVDISKQVFNILTSPDADTKLVAKGLMAGILQLKKQIPRCEKAFAKIEDSIGLFENKMDTYYRDYIQSRNPSTILESFTIDISNTTKTDPQTTRQFRKIISYYQKATQGRVKDPRVNKIFDTLNYNFDIMENSDAKSGGSDAKSGGSDAKSGGSDAKSGKDNNKKPITEKNKDLSEEKETAEEKDEPRTQVKKVRSCSEDSNDYESVKK